MANASAKKSAAARQAAASFYRPLLLGMNAIFLLLCYYQHHLRFSSDRYETEASSVSTVRLVVTTILVWVVQYLSYQSILDDAALLRASSSSRGHQPSTKGRGGSSSSSGNTRLAGGLALDALAIATISQFAGLLWSPKAYYLLLLLPIGALFNILRSLRKTWSSLMRS